MEHLHHRFVAADGAGSDAMVAFEATEVASTHRARSLVPVRPPEPLAGAPDRSPIPLADNVTGGVAVVQASAARARTAAGGSVAGLVRRVQDLLPRRRTAYRRVTPATAKRETQRRAAMAVLAFVAVLGGLFGVVYAMDGQTGKTPLATVAAAEAALRTIHTDLDQVFAPGVDLVVGDPHKAMGLLTEAYQAVDAADQAHVPPATLDPLRDQVVGGLDRLFHVVPVAGTTVLAFASDKVQYDLEGLVRGPDGMPYVIDRATSSVYRIDTRTKKANLVFRYKTHAAGGTEGVPKFITTGGRDLVIVDDKNVVWRWRAKDTKGDGTTTQIRVAGSAGWGDDVVAVGTFLRDQSAGLYNLYLVDPSAQNIIYYTPARDGGFPVNAQPRLPVSRDVSKVTDLVIDGDIFVADGGTLVRFVGGNSEGWSIQPPGYSNDAQGGDTLLRPEPDFTRIASASDKRTGLIYAWDKVNGRVVAWDKAKGTFVEQYRLAGASPAWQDVRGMYVVLGAGPDVPSTLVWVTKDAVMSAVLEAVPDSATPGASGSPAPSGSAGPSGSPRASSGSSARPKATP
jgi:hypothetical protein